MSNSCWRGAGITLTLRVSCVPQHPQFLLTYSDDMPQKIKLRKRISAWPLQLVFRADYSRRLRAFQYGVSLKAKSFLPEFLLERAT